jgi:hypothetical protein
VVNNRRFGCCGGHWPIHQPGCRSAGHYFVASGGGGGGGVNSAHGGAGGGGGSGTWTYCITEYDAISGGEWNGPTYDPQRPTGTRCAYCRSTAAPHANGTCHGCGSPMREKFIIER